MIHIQFEYLLQSERVFSVLLKAIPQKGDTICFNHDSAGEFKVKVEKVTHIIPHSGLSPECPEVILTVREL